MFKSAPPGEGGTSAPVKFDTTDCLPGYSWDGWIAGPIPWLKCHTARKQFTKPCIKWLTEGAHSCPRCTPHWRLETLGHVPIYRKSDNKACLVIVRETTRDFLTGCDYGTFVTVSKESGKGQPLTIMKAARQQKFVTSIAQRHKPADLEYSLLTIWAINELWEWARARGGPAPQPKIDPEALDTESTGAVQFPLNRLAAAFDVRAQQSRERAELEAKNAETARQMAERNGKPHKPH